MISFFENRKVFIATKHQKEKVIIKTFDNYFKFNYYDDLYFETDQFGTFSGEINRKNTALETLKLKCYEASKLIDLQDIVVASEGSFGAHPYLPFAAVDEELMMLYDPKNNLEIIAKHVSLETNFNQDKVSDLYKLVDFAKNAKFPTHALILKSSDRKDAIIIKDIFDFENLEESFYKLKKISSEIIVETDMRAMNNPTRMKVIQEIAQKLVEKMKSLCPNCETPGFDIVEFVSGLPCSWCKQPTRSTLKHVFKCKKCDHQEEVFFPNQKKFEEPEFCEYCNP